jgi:hypothetical protein
MNRARVLGGVVYGEAISRRDGLRHRSGRLLLVGGQSLLQEQLGDVFISHNTYPHARLLQVQALIALARRRVNMLWAIYVTSGLGAGFLRPFR